MALTVDQLLAADSSSDEETPAVGGRSGAAGRADGAPSDAGEGQRASGDSGVVGGGPALAAFLENSDDEDEGRAEGDGHGGQAAAPREKHQAPIPAAVDQMSDASEVSHGEVKEATKVGLDDLLAMDSDSSDERGGRKSPRAAAAVPASKKGPEAAALHSATAGGVARQAPDGGAVVCEPGPAQAEGDLEPFLRSPFSWCLEHERNLLLGSGIEEPATGEYDHRGACGGLSTDQMFDMKPCGELQKLLSRELGLPTCVLTHEKFIAVCTIRGAVVLLDPKLRDVGPQPQVLCPPSNEEGVAVSAAACSADCSSILLGHKNGQLSLWDLTNQKLAHAVKDIHKTCVLSLAFPRASWQYALSADAGGSVQFLTFTSTFGRRDCSPQLLLERSSNIGVTLRISPLPPMPHQATHPADTNCLVALCATNATVLLTLHPSAQLLQKMQYHTKDAAAHATWVPDVVWLRPEIRDTSDSEKPVDPRLCTAFGQTIHIMLISHEMDVASGKEEFKIKLLHRYTWSAPIWSIVAFSEGVLGLLDTSNKLSVVQLPSPLDEDKPKGIPEPKRQLEPVRVEDVSGTPLVYHTHTSLDGSKDSRSHHGALAVFKGRSRALYICGMKEVWHLQIGRWGQHIEDLVAKGSWAPSLSALLALHDGRLPSLLDFPHAASARQRAVGSRATQVIQSYLVSSLQPDTTRAEARRMCGTAVHVCVEMRLWLVLYKTVFECFKAAGHMNVYCNTLEPFIVKGRIPRGRMDSEVLASILQSYALPLEEEEQLATQHIKGASVAPLSVDSDHCAQLFPVARRLQQLALYVDVMQLDLNLTIRLFTQHRLWTALVHVYCSMKDFASPLEILVGECSQLIKGCQPQVQVAAGLEAEKPLLQCLLVRKLFFYLHRCFELQPFPLDEQDSPGLAFPEPGAIFDLLKCIFKPGAASVDGRPRAPPVFLRLLRLSPLGLFGALSSLFTSPSTSEALQSNSQQDRPCVLGDSEVPLASASLFAAIEAAVEASRQQAEDEGQPLPPSTDSELLWFVARAAPRAKLELPATQCVRVVEHLLASWLPVSRFGLHAPSEAQRLVIGVLSVQGPLPQATRDSFVAQAVQQGFFGVASWLHERHGEYGHVLDCRLQDKDLREQVFDYIVTRLEELTGDPDEAASLVDAALQRLQRLVGVDAERCSLFICEQLTAMADHTAVLNRLQGHPDIELQYLETLLVLRQRGQWRRLEEQQAFFEAHVVRYVALLCSLRPSAVLPFIVENEALPLRECLELCNKHQVTDASIHLLERTGDFVGVLQLLLCDYGKALELLNWCFVEARDQNRAAITKVLKRLDALAKARDTEETPITAPEDSKAEAPWWEGCKEAQRCVELLDQAYEMSSRNSNIMTDAQLEELWFGVLGRTVRWQEKASAEPSSKRHAGLSAALGELKSKAMSGVLAYLSLPAALKWICSEFGPSALGFWKDPLESMLSGLSFQQGLLRAARAVAAQDVTKPFMAVKRKGSRGVRLSPEGEVLSTQGGGKAVEVRFIVEASLAGAQQASQSSGGSGIG